MKVASTDPRDLIAWKNIDSRAMLIILDGVKDHIVPHLSGKKTASEMWKCYGEKLPMAWGVPQQTDKPQKSILSYM